MLNDILIVSALILCDFMLLKLMLGFYFTIGIPILKKSIEVKPNVSLEDIKVYVGISEELVYKIVGNRVIFRSRFSYSQLKRLKILSIIKGDIIMETGKAIITQRMSMSTIYIYLFFIYLCFTQHIDVLGYVFLGIIILLTIISNLIQNVKLNDICKSMETNINQVRTASRWPD